MELRNRCHCGLVLQMMTLILLSTSPFASARPDDPMAWPFNGYAGFHNTTFTDSQSTILPAAFQTDAEIHQLPKVPHEVDPPENSPSAGFLQQGSNLNSAPATIPINAPNRSDSRFHARQTRLSLDARWAPVGESAV